ncbi:MAG: site-2 protease family protein [Candidatus Zixiibacteriota bacterium]|nr:MAG: site-2 protease family protein [candidate division Zixibacteria bacterium]
MGSFLLQAIFFLPPFLLAISVHESAHGYVAYRFGDPTAKNLGRITLNPIPHIDIFGLIAIFIVHFGWAKPVPVNPRNLKNPIKDNLWISLAGPASNLLLAIASGIVFRILSPVLSASEAGLFILLMIQFSVILNIVLMVFNLFPIPPLDGFHILEGIVSHDIYLSLQKFRSAGPMILFGLIILSSVSGLNIFAVIFNPFVKIIGGILLGEPAGW